MLTVRLIDRPTLDLDAATIATNGEITPTDILDGDLGLLTTASPRDYGFKRNGIGEATIVHHVLDPLAITDLRYGTNDLLQRELWIFDDDVCVWMGVPGPWAVDLDDQTVTVRCREVTQLLNGKVFGRADRINLVDNGGFEDDPTDFSPWTEFGSGTVEIDDTFANEDDQSLKITSTGGSDGVIQALTTISHGYAPGLVLTLAGWCYIAAADAVATGTVLASIDATDGVTTLPQETFATDATFLFDQWQRVEVTLLLSAGTSWDVDVSLRSIDGVIWWDSIQSVFPDATTMSLGDDIGVLIGNVVEYSQTPTDPVGQSDDVIGHDVTTVGMVPSGPRGFAHDLHENIWRDGLMQLAEEFQLDIWLGMDRLIHADVHRGTLRADLAVTVEIVDGELSVSPSSVAAVQVDGDPSQEYSSVIVIGEGSSFAREEVGRVDTTAFAGLVKTLVQRAPNSATVRSMGDQADALLSQSKQPAALPSITYAGITPPEPGDTVAISIDFGCVFFDDTLRIEAVRIEPKTGAVTCSFDVDWA